MRQPLYREVADQIRSEILAGRLAEGTQLAPEPELAKRYRVSRPTLREALGVLEREGLISKFHGIGTFIRRQGARIQAGLENLESYTESIRRQGYSAEDRVLSVTPRTIGELGMEEFGPPDTIVPVIDSLRLAEGRAVIYCRDVLLPGVAVDVARVAEARPRFESLLDFLQAELGLYLAHGQLAIHALAAPAEVANRLSVAPGTPVLCLTGPTFDRSGSPVYHSTNYFRTDLYTFTFVRQSVS